MPKGRKVQGRCENRVASVVGSDEHMSSKMSSVLMPGRQKGDLKNLPD
jgi:hypothetical protein